MDSHPTLDKFPVQPRVLIVTGADLEAEIGRTVLFANGVPRTVTERLDEAQEAARTLRPRLVVIDAATIRPATALVHTLREDPLTRDTSIAVLAGRRGLREAGALRAAGANAVLARPVEAALWDSRLRQFLSVPTRRPLSVSVRLRAWSGGVSAASFEGRALNVSPRGMLVETARPIAVGTKLDVEFLLPGTTQATRLLGEAIRTEWKARSARTGIEFLVVPDEARPALMAFAQADPTPPALAPPREASELSNDKSGWERELRASEARRTALLASVREAVIVLDHDGRIVEFNRQAELTFGRSGHDVLGRAAWDVLSPPQLRERHRARFARFLSLPGPHQGGVAESRGVRGDGQVFSLEMVAVPTEVKGRRYLTTVIRDVAARKAAERAALLEMKVARILADPRDERDTLALVLAELCGPGGWNVANLWMVDPATDLLRCGLTYHGAGGPFIHLHSASREHPLARGTDLPGRAWLSSAVVWANDVRRDASFTRRAAAERGKLRSAMAFPLQRGARALGVIECLSRDLRTGDQALDERLLAVGRQIGQGLAATRAVQDERRRGGMLEAVAGASVAFLRGDAWADSVGELLEGLGTSAGASRAYVCEGEDEAASPGLRRLPRQEWVASGVAPRPALSPAYPIGTRGSPRWVEELRTGLAVTSRMGSALERERDVLGDLGIRSTVLVPVRSGARFRGILALEDAVTDREWSTGEISALRCAASLLAMALDGPESR
jgi:PAS domain S-box-containing protein